MRWDEDGKDFDGVPFHITGVRLFDCHHGKDWNIAAKQKLKDKKNKMKVNVRHFKNLTF